MPTLAELEKLAEMYLLAKSDESKQDSFVQEIAFAFSELYNRGISELIYDPTGREYYGCGLQLCQEKMMTSAELDSLELGMEDAANFAVLPQFSRMGRHDRFPIFITKQAFKIDSLDEFLNVLVDHESVHTKDLMEGIDIGDIFFLDYKNAHRLRFGALCAISEVRADENLLDEAKNKGLTGTNTYFRRKSRILDRLQKIKDVNRYPYNKFEERVTTIFLDEFYKRQQHKSI